ncbi:type II toxin-antitoxin system RelB/DinJ family antitoxin [Sulfuricurvum sp. IAE1]|jgi:DNA-damage-inducible protein J|uniref:type II toxin-antitoxin system RelB/DinJ family antitoxin n=1 Tax=Sulfuricurvum sp. IAE1 TaxID=2546102 RepID=UPI00104974BB|nr:type II toxin-antitoxin system RelB/DinJ family antitoxin [Sulfuricurvum sp. IAE1]MDD3770580.1 type II toxin-antitoxin system RelB/DinJ family antitoxin [Sulfuricurvum sp.]TDA64188.1 type II toxin-antitoxin system RelB/DinJ family antitoxin [Sulfuricurvum sp. IAE1]
MTGTAMTVRIDPEIKNKAAEYLKQMGLTTSEATRLFLHSVVLHKGLPFELRIPNDETEAAIQDVKKGKNIVKHTSAKELFDDLGL